MHMQEDWELNTGLLNAQQRIELPGSDEPAHRDRA